MSTRSAAAPLATSGAQGSRAHDTQADNRSPLSSALSDTPGTAASANSVPTQSRASSGDGDFQTLLTHVGESTGPSSHSGDRGAASSSASTTKSRGRKSDTQHAHSDCTAPSATPANQVVVTPVAPAAVPSGTSSAGGANTGSASAGAIAGSAASSATAVAQTSADAASASASASSPAPDVQGTSNSGADGSSSAVASGTAKQGGSQGTSASDGTGDSSPLDLHTLLTQALVHAPAQQAGAAGAAKGAHDPGGTTASAGQSAAGSPVSSTGGATGPAPVTPSSGAGNASSGSGSGGTSATPPPTGAQVDARSALTHTVQGRTDLAAQLPAQASPLLAKAALSAPVGTAHWTDELGNQLIWMAHQSVDAASLHVSPAGLGPIEARIAVQGGTASVWFGATHPDTRAALERALPRLREMFATQGMSLADSGVFREAPQQRRQPVTAAAVSSIKPLTAPSTATTRSAVQPGLVDLYA